MEQSIKLFVPLGTQKFPFNRLVESLNALVRDGKYTPGEIVIQSSVYEERPLFKFLKMIPNDQFNDLIHRAETVLTHSGVNSIITCMRLHKPLVIVPRMKKYGEHVDNHQIEIANLMHERFGVSMVTDMNELEAALISPATRNYKPWIPDSLRLVRALRADIDRLAAETR